MKRIFSTVLLVCVLATCLFAFASCGGHPMDEIKEDIKNGNYTMTTTASVMGVQMTVTVLVDGDKVCAEVMGAKSYVEKDGDKAYMYTPNLAGGYEKTEIPADEADEQTGAFSDEVLDKLFNKDNYTEDENGNYVINDGVDVEGFDGVTMSFKDGKCTIKAGVEGADTTITFSEMGSTTVTLPEVE